MINVTKTTLPSVDEYLSYLKKIWKSNWVTNGGQLSIELEKKLKNFLRVENLTVVANGTLAMQMVFRAFKLEGEVITTPFTFPATTNALLWERLKPVFADIDIETFNIDSYEIEKKITSKTSAILAVHVFGNPCNVETIEQIAEKHKIKVIYDSAHVFGVLYKGKSILNWGDASTLSFHAAKIFHTIEGGAIVVHKKRLLKELNLMRNHGIAWYEKVLIPGTNAKMNEFEAAMGLCLLPIFKKERDKRKKFYERYSSAFSSDPELRLQKLNPGLTFYNYPYFPICFPSEKIRDKIHNLLLKHGIHARKYFYPPCDEFPYIDSPRHSLPNSTNISHTILCLPLYGSLPIKAADKIVDIVSEA